MDDRIYYQTDLDKVECVSCGVYRGRHWVISSVAGDHPCAYVETKNGLFRWCKRFRRARWN